MNVYLAFAIIAVVSYLVGSVNFARIIAWKSRKKDITELGSGNPGTMNMLRNVGFVPALITFLVDITKSGLCCLVSKICMQGSGVEELAFFFAGLFVVIGNVFPVFYKFKGGKGVASMVGMLFFTPIWWVGFILFLLLAILLFIIDYGVISSIGFIVGMNTAVTIYVFLKDIPYAWAITAIIWILALLVCFKHRGNFVRLIKGKENKAGFTKSIKKIFRKQKGVEEISEEQVESEPETEIIIDEDDDKKGN